MNAKAANVMVIGKFISSYMSGYILGTREKSPYKPDIKTASKRYSFVTKTDIKQTMYRTRKRVRVSLWVGKI